MQEIKNNNEHQENMNLHELISSLNLTNDQQQCITNILEKVMNKYQILADNAENRGNEKSSAYFSGVVDGLNNAYKIVMDIEDDFLSGL